MSSNARSIVNRKCWAYKDAELGLTGYIMSRKEILGRRGGGVILYIKISRMDLQLRLRMTRQWFARKTL